MTVEDSWGLSDRGLVADAFEKFQSDVRSLMASCILKYGGPENYLRARFPTAEAKQEWINYLAEIQDTTARGYHTAVDLPVSDVKTLSQAHALIVCACCFWELFFWQESAQSTRHVGSVKLAMEHRKIMNKHPV